MEIYLLLSLIILNRHDKVGPGYYSTDVSESWNSPWYAHFARQLGPKKVIEPSPASIPSHDRVFGYEETEEGKIVNQNPKHNVSSGTLNS